MFVAFRNFLNHNYGIIFLLQQEGIEERLKESEKLMQEISQTWEEKLRKTEKIHQVHKFIYFSCILVMSYFIL